MKQAKRKVVCGTDSKPHLLVILTLKMGFGISPFSEYANEPNSIIVGVFNEQQIIGFISGLTLNSGSSTVQPCYQLLVQKTKIFGIDIEQCFYIAEMIILPEYRSYKIFRDSLKLLEREAKNLACSRFCFLTVWREENHKLKPANYKGLEPLFIKNHYKKTDLKTQIAWTTVTDKASSKFQGSTS